MATVTELKPDRIRSPEVFELSPRVVESLAEIVDRRGKMEGYALGLLRLGVGWIFLWAFLDKLFGLGFATEAGKGWIDGGSPTFGFLNFATKGPFAELYSEMAASPVVEWMFMLGLLGIGLPLLLGVGVRIAGPIGIAMYALMYTVLITPNNNPFMDDHIVGIIIVAGLVLEAAGSPIGQGKLWVQIRLVKRYPILK